MAEPGPVYVVTDSRGAWPAQMAERLHTLGYRAVLVVPTNPGGPLPDGAAFDDVLTVADVTDPALLAAGIRTHCDRLAAAPAAIVTASDTPMVAAALAATQLGVARAPWRGFARARDKAATRRALVAAGLPCPAYAVITGPEQAADVAATVGLPAVIKPVNGAGSALVRVVRTVEDLADAYRLLAQRVPLLPGAAYGRPLVDSDGTGVEPGLDPRRAFLVESVLDGPEYCVDVIVRDGQGSALPVIGKPLVDDRFFEDVSVSPPFDVDPGTVEAIAAAAVDAVLAVGLDNTVAHVEVIDDATGGPTVVEINAGRPGGSLLAMIDWLHGGMDIYAEQVGLAVGAPPVVAVAAPMPAPVACVVIYPPGKGELVAVHGLDELRELPEVLQVLSAVTPGERITDDVGMLLVNVLVAGFVDRADLLELHSEITATVRVELTAFAATALGAPA